MLLRLNVSMSNREPEPPRNTRNNGPEPLDTDVMTFWKTSQSPVGGTGTVPSSVPVAEPDRTSIVPPAPADDTRAVKVRAPAVLTDAYPAQSPFSREPKALPPLAAACGAIWTPDPDVNDSPSTAPAWVAVAKVNASRSNRLPCP